MPLERIQSDSRARVRGYYVIIRAAISLPIRGEIISPAAALGKLNNNPLLRASFSSPQELFQKVGSFYSAGPFIFYFDMSF